MTPYSVPDLTGVNPAYLQVNLLFHVYENFIKITFENSPVFLDSIRVIRTDGSTDLLLQDTHWEMRPDDVDQTAMSKAYLEDPSFDKILVKSITMISPDIVGKTIAINVQQFYDTIPGRLFDDGAPFEVTPALLKNIVAGLADVRQQVVKVRSPITPVDHVPQLLKLDINKQLSENFITDEVITTNSVSGGKVIQLSQGAFFFDGLKLTYDGEVLDENTDYLPIMLSPLTKQTTSTKGIYNYILLIKPINGELHIDYHAVGGGVQQDDIASLYELAVSIKTFLNEQVFITPESISQTSAFSALHARLLIQEENMRSLLSGTVTYGDATANQMVRRPIAATNSNFHWYTIAKLYQVEGSTDVSLTDQFKGRVFFPGTKVSLSFTVDVNFNQQRNPVTITSNNLVFDPLYTLFADTSPSAPVYPALRVCWNNTSQGLSGAVLQVGIPLTSLSDQMVVEDMSTTESCWLLDKTGAQIIGNEPVTPSAPRDTGFTLPDGQAIWSNISANSLSKVHFPVYEPGYLMYVGAVVNLNSIDNVELSERPATVGNSTKNLFGSRLPSYFDFDSIKQTVITIASPLATTIYDVVIDVVNVNATVKFGKMVFKSSEGRTVGMSVTLTRELDNSISVSVNTAGTTVDEEDIVRYIRVRV